MDHSPVSERGAPLCPVGHLPREGGDRSPRRFPSSVNGASKCESDDTAISPLAGEMPTGREGRLALSLPAFKLAEARR